MPRFDDRDLDPMTRKAGGLVIPEHADRMLDVFTGHGGPLMPNYNGPLVTPPPPDPPTLLMSNVIDVRHLNLILVPK